MGRKYSDTVIGFVHDISNAEVTFSELLIKSFDTMRVENPSQIPPNLGKDANIGYTFDFVLMVKIAMLVRDDSQRDLAEKCDVSVSTLNRFLKSYDGDEEVAFIQSSNARMISALQGYIDETPDIIADHHYTEVNYVKNFQLPSTKKFMHMDDDTAKEYIGADDMQLSDKSTFDKRVGYDKLPEYMQSGTYLTLSNMDLFADYGYVNETDGE